MPRTLIAFYIAPLVVPLLLALTPRELSGTDLSDRLSVVVGAFVAYAGVWAIGGPAYLFLRARRWTSFWLAPLLGFAIGAVMWLVFGVLFGLSLGHSLAGALSLTAQPNFSRGILWPGGVTGAATGIVFWLIARPDR